MRARVIVPIVGASLAAAAAALVLPSIEGGEPGALVAGPSPAATSPPRALSSRTVRAGEVDVVIEPVRIDAAGAVFVVTMDTHSEDLSADVARAARLVVDGVPWSGASWSGDGPGGHHRSGELRFVAGGPASGRAKLSIGGFSEPVVVSWTLPGS